MPKVCVVITIGNETVRIPCRTINDGFYIPDHEVFAKLAKLAEKDATYADMMNEQVWYAIAEGNEWRGDIADYDGNVIASWILEHDGKPVTDHASFSAATLALESQDTVTSAGTGESVSRADADKAMADFAAWRAARAK
jgi:hypothetical protein